MGAIESLIKKIVVALVVIVFLLFLLGILVLVCVCCICVPIKEKSESDKRAKKTYLKLSQKYRSASTGGASEFEAGIAELKTEQRAELKHKTIKGVEVAALV